MQLYTASPGRGTVADTDQSFIFPSCTLVHSASYLIRTACCLQKTLVHFSFVVCAQEASGERVNESIHGTDTDLNFDGQLLFLCYNLIF